MKPPIDIDRAALLKEVRKKEIGINSEIIQYFYEDGRIVSVGVIGGEVKYKVIQTKKTRR